MDPKTLELVSDEVCVQAEQALNNLKALLEDNNSSLVNVVKTNVFLVDIADFGKVNEVYAKFFTEGKPARSCVAVH